MKTFQKYINYGEEQTIEITGKYLKAIARAMDGYSIISGAELLVMADDSEEVSKIRLFYVANGSMCEPLFDEVHKFCSQQDKVIDILSFTYNISGNKNKTGVIVVLK